MQWELFPYLAPYYLSLAISLSIAVYSWRHRSVPGAFPYGWVAFGQAAWTFGYIFELVGPNLDAKIFWDDFQWLGVLISIVAFPVAILQYVGLKSLTTRKLWVLSAVVPIFFLVFLAVPPWHTFIHSQERVIPGEPFSSLIYNFMPWVYGIVLYGYAIYFACLIVLLRKFFSLQSLYRMQITMILLGTIIPVIGISLTMAGIKLTFQRDTSPISFAIGNLIIAWGLFRFRLFSLVPIARDTIFENMTDLVVVLDKQDRIVDINPSALRAIEKNPTQVIGKPAEDVFAAWPELIRDLTEPIDKFIEADLHAFGKAYTREMVQRHPTIAHQLLSRIPFLNKALDIPFYHHEKWDGSGYPRGLKGDEIPLAARIFAIVDVWDAVQSNRPYKEAWSRDKAVAYIREQTGKHFDPEIVKIFLLMVAERRI